MTADNRDPVRVLGRVTQEQFDKWKAAAASIGITFTELAKTALDLHCQLIKIKLAEKPKEPRRKLPKQVHHKLPKKLNLKKENSVRRKGEIEPALLLVLVVLGLIVVIALGAWIVPQYNVWAAGKAGEATLMRAEQEKQIQIEQAKAELESAKLRAQAIETIGEMIQKYPEYREQEFIGAFGEAIKSGEIDQIIYVPTEANIPITESGRIRRGEQ